MEEGVGVAAGVRVQGATCLAISAWLLSVEEQ